MFVSFFFLKAGDNDPSVKVVVLVPTKELGLQATKNIKVSCFLASSGIATQIIICTREGGRKEGRGVLPVFCVQNCQIQREYIQFKR